MEKVSKVPEVATPDVEVDVDVVVVEADVVDPVVEFEL